MLKVVGSALVACSATGFGFYMAWREKQHIKALEEAIRAVELLKIAVTKQLMPLQEALRIYSRQNLLFKALQEKKDVQTDSLLRKMLYTAEETAILQALFDSIPRAQAGDASHFDAARDQLILRLNDCRKASAQSAALYPKLGLLVGVGVFLLMM